MDTVRSRDGTTIAFDRLGEGPPLILVGGAFQHRAIDAPGAALAALLSAHFTVFHYDRRGRGDSGDTPPYAVEREIEDLGALIEEGGGSAFVFGGSSGAVLALEAAARGHGITKLAMYEPPFIVDDSRAPLPEDYVTRLNELVSAGRRGDAVEYFMTQAFGLPPEAAAGMREAPYWPALEDVAHTLAYDGTFMAEGMRGTPEPLQKWASVRVPTLVIDGGDSPSFQHNAVRTLVEILPHSQRRTMEGQTHEVAPDLLAPVLKEFFAA
jgi:pimeloyl-ACP methyl ester carboxylesterase